MLLTVCVYATQRKRFTVVATVLDHQLAPLLPTPMSYT